MTQKTENRGGKRPGAGRKPRFENSDRFIQELIAAEDASVAEGKPSIAEKLIAAAKGRDKQQALAAQRIFWDKVVTKAGEQEITSTKHEAPGVMLPPEQPDRGVGESPPVKH